MSLREKQSELRSRSTETTREAAQQAAREAVSEALEKERERQEARAERQAERQAERIAERLQSQIAETAAAADDDGPSAEEIRETLREVVRAELERTVEAQAEQRTEVIMDTLNGPWQRRLSETQEVARQITNKGAEMKHVAWKINKEHAKQNRQKRKHVGERTFLAMLVVAVLMGWGPALIDGVQNWWTGRTEVELTAKEQKAREENADKAALLDRIESAYRALEADEKKVFRGMLGEAERRIEKQTGRTYPKPIVKSPKSSSGPPTSSAP